eukprot:14707293-Alexandrium_andersonii.AAC.1
MGQEASAVSPADRRLRRSMEVQERLRRGGAHQGEGEGDAPRVNAVALKPGPQVALRSRARQATKAEDRGGGRRHPCEDQKVARHAPLDELEGHLEDLPSELARVGRVEPEVGDQGGPLPLEGWLGPDGSLHAPLELRVVQEVDRAAVARQGPAGGRGEARAGGDRAVARRTRAERGVELAGEDPSQAEHLLAVGPEDLNAPAPDGDVGALLQGLRRRLGGGEAEVSLVGGARRREPPSDRRQAHTEGPGHLLDGNVAGHATDAENIRGEDREVGGGWTAQACVSSPRSEPARKSRSDAAG